MHLDLHWMRNCLTFVPVIAWKISLQICVPNRQGTFSAKWQITLAPSENQWISIGCDHPNYAWVHHNHVKTEKLFTNTPFHLQFKIDLKQNIHFDAYQNVYLKSITLFRVSSFDAKSHFHFSKTYTFRTDIGKCTQNFHRHSNSGEKEGKKPF